jgi:uncharacterized protein (DUF305 family)
VGHRADRTDRTDRPRRRARSLAAALVVAALGLGACSGDHGGMAMDPGSGTAMEGMDDHMGSAGTVDVPADAAFNAADVAFAQEMIVHHGQAVAMAKVVLAAGTDAEVRALAEQIEAAQAPEIATMTGWLESWGYEAPDPSSGAMGDMGPDGTMPAMAMPGMRTDAEMTALEGATGADLDRLFLTMMIRHHEGAIEMATTLLADGESAEARALAQAIIATQQSEIEAMETMLAARPG